MPFFLNANYFFLRLLGSHHKLSAADSPAFFTRPGRPFSPNLSVGCLGTDSVERQVDEALAFPGLVFLRAACALLGFLFFYVRAPGAFIWCSLFPSPPFLQRPFANLSSPIFVEALLVVSPSYCLSCR